MIKLKRKDRLPLSILTQDDLGLPIVPERPPVAKVSYLDSFSGEQNIEITLNLSNGQINAYEGYFDIPETIAFGQHSVTYVYKIDSTTEKEVLFEFEINQDDFNETDKELHLFEVLDEILAMDYLPPASQQEEADVAAQGNEIRLRIKSPILKNHSYTLILDGVKLKDGRVINSKKVSIYHAEYGPLFTSLEDVKQELKELYILFKTKAVYRSIRNAGEKALQMHRLVADVNHKRYKPMKDNDEKLFPTMKYVLYEACYTLITDLYHKLLYDSSSYLNDTENDEDDLLDKSVLFNGFTLGDFSVKGVGEDNSSDPEGVKDVTEALIKKIRPLLSYLAEQRKFWQDAMKNRNARGYTTPRASEIKRDVTAESRDI